MALDKWRTLYPTSRHTLRSQTLWQRLNTDPGTPAQNRWRMSSEPSRTGGEIKTKNKPVPDYDTKCFYNADTADLTCPPAVTNSQINGEIIESIIVSAYKISPIKSIHIKSKVNIRRRGQWKSEVCRKHYGENKMSFGNRLVRNTVQRLTWHSLTQSQAILGRSAEYWPPKQAPSTVIC